MVAFGLDASEGLAPLMVTSVPPGFFPSYGGTNITGSYSPHMVTLVSPPLGNPIRGDPMRPGVLVPSIWLRLVLPEGNVRATDGSLYLKTLFGPSSAL